MSSKVREWLQQGEAPKLHEPIQRLHGESVDLYSIKNDSFEPYITTRTSRKHKDLQSKHHQQKFLSSDSSIIPFAESGDLVIKPIQKLRRRDCLRGSKNTHKPTPEIPDEGISPRIDCETKDPRPRPRYKIRYSRQKQISRLTKEDKEISVKNKYKHSYPKVRKKGDALINLPTDSLINDRLTLRASHNLGIFKKGRASNLVRKGLPDLAFSEMKFLDRRSFTPSTTSQKGIPKPKKDKICQSRRAKKKKISYFDSPRKYISENTPGATTISSVSYNKPREWPKRDHTLKERSPKAVTAECPNKPSPRSTMLDALHRKSLYSLPVNQSPQRSNSGSVVINGDAIGGEGSSINIDGHSEYSRVGFQKRFGPEIKGPERLYKQGTLLLGKSSHVEPLGHVEGIYTTRSQEREDTYACSILKLKDKKVDINTKDKQASDIRKSIATIRKPPILRARCTPELSQFEKIPGSSSPLAALLRVCADSPIGSAVSEEHGRRNGRILRHGAPKIVTGTQTQMQIPYTGPSKKLSRPVAIPQVRTPMPLQVLHKVPGGSSESFDNWDVLPKILYAKSVEDSLYLGQRKRKSRNPGIREQIPHSPLSDYIDDTYAKDYTNYVNDQTLKATSMEDLFETDTWGLFEVRREQYKTPNKRAMSEYGKQKFVADPFTRLSPEYALATTSDCHILRQIDGDLNEKRQMPGFEQPDAIIDRGQFISTGGFLIDSEYNNNMDFDEQESRQEPAHDHPGPKRESFWRQHRL